MRMSKLITIGEALIDFIPLQKGCKLKDVKEFNRVAGGAPANVAACVAKLGGESYVLTKLGVDAFGDFIIEELNKANVNTSEIKRTTEANTALAFVSLSEEGERDFSFYRNPSADMLLTPDEVNKDLFNRGDVLHFCSVDLVESPMKYAHDTALKYALDSDVLVSFDPNLRFPLWNNLDEYRNTVLEYIPFAHILKVSDDELEFITQYKDVDKGIQSLFVGNVQIIIYTRGAKGANIYKRDGSKVFVPSYTSVVKDTTGAGDSFIGAVIYQLLRKGVTIDTIAKNIDKDILQYGHAVSAIVVNRYGAMQSLPNNVEVQDYIDKNNQQTEIKPKK